jgi:serine protease Do
VTVLTPAHIASGSTTDGLPARVVRFTGFEESDVAILRVDASNMPTVPLAASIAGIKSDQFVTTLGFPGSAQDPPSGATEPPSSSAASTSAQKAQTRSTKPALGCHKA